MSPVSGSTRAEREKARHESRQKKRSVFYKDRISNAPTSRERLAQTCDYARAVGDDLDDAGRDLLAGLIAKLADEMNQP